MNIHKRDQRPGDAPCMTYIATLRDGNQHIIRAVSHDQALSITQRAPELALCVGLFCATLFVNLMSDGKVLT